MGSLPEINVTTKNATARKASGSLKAAGSLVAKTAERTKLVTVTLPRAYCELGKAVYKQPGRRRDFPDLFSAIENLLAERRKIKEQAEAKPAATSLTDKAKRVAADAADLAKSKSIDLQALQAFTRLGEAVYQKLGADVGSPELVDRIAVAIDRRAQLDRDMAAINKSAKGSWLTPQRIVVGVGSLLVVVVLGNLFGRTERSFSYDKSPGGGGQPLLPGGTSDNSASKDSLAAEYKKMIQNERMRTCSEVFCAWQRFADNGSVLPQSRSYDLTLPELVDKYGGIVGWGGKDNAKTYSYQWRSSGAEVPLTIWQKLCGAATIKTLRAHERGFREENVQNLKSQWGGDLKEVAFECVDGTIFFIGKTQQRPVIGDVFQPVLAHVTLSEGRGDEDTGDGVKLRFRPAPQAEDKKWRPPSDEERLKQKLVGCPTGKSERYQTGWAAAVGTAQIFDQERKQMRKQIDNIAPDVPKDVYLEQLETGTGKRRMELMERLMQAKKDLKVFRKDDPNRDLTEGQVEGYEYALRHVLKEQY